MSWGAAHNCAMTAAPSQESIAVVLMNMGGPADLNGVAPFLRALFSDPAIINLPAFLRLPLARYIAYRRAPASRRCYQQIGGRSPIADLTRQQALLLEKHLNAAGKHRYQCHVAMRYAAPHADEVALSIAQSGAATVVALPLYPHASRATRDSSLDDLRRALKEQHLDDRRLIEVPPFFSHPLYLDALAEQIRIGLQAFPLTQPNDITIIFSAHGLPRSFIRHGDPYVEHLEATISGVLARLTPMGLHNWRLAYQSRTGRNWLTPSTSEVLRELAQAGHGHVLAVPISFVCDHLETLYEMDLVLAGEARGLGLNFQRAPSLNTAPSWISALAQLVEDCL